jgi:ParB-like nuclease domain
MPPSKRETSQPNGRDEAGRADRDVSLARETGQTRLSRPTTPDGHHVVAPPEKDAASPASDQAAETCLLAFHSLADKFALMEGDEFDELVADIKKNGLRAPITIYEDQILDGRNRYRACLAAEIEPDTVAYQGNDPAGFVVSANVHRRHLTRDQKRGLIDDLLREDPARSNVEISKLAQSNDKKVASERARLERTSEIPRLTKTTGADGKARPARRMSIKPRVNKITPNAAQSARDALAAATLAWCDATAADQTRFVSSVGIHHLFRAAPSDEREAFRRRLNGGLMSDPVAAPAASPLSETTR